MNRRVIVILLAVVALAAIVLIAQRGAAPRRPPPAVRAPAVSPPPVPGTTPADTSVVHVPPPPPNRPERAGIAIYLVALGDDGRSGPRIGCGDSIVPLTQAMELGNSTTAGRILEALGALFAIHDRTVGPRQLYDALSASRLAVDEVSQTAGRMTVAIKGTLSLAGECDGPRAREQIERTVRQFPGARDATILVNGMPLATAFSLK